MRRIELWSPMVMKGYEKLSDEIKEELSMLIAGISNIINEIKDEDIK